MIKEIKNYKKITSDKIYINYASHLFAFHSLSMEYMA